MSNSKNSNISIIQALAVTLALKITHFFFHITPWLMMMHHQIKFGYKMFSNSKGIVKTKSRTQTSDSVQVIITRLFSSSTLSIQTCSLPAELADTSPQRSGHRTVALSSKCCERSWQSSDKVAGPCPCKCSDGPGTQEHSHPTSGNDKIHPCSATLKKNTGINVLWGLYSV